MADVTAKVFCSSKTDTPDGDERQPALSLSMTLRGAVADRFEAGRPYVLTFTESE